MMKKEWHAVHGYKIGVIAILIVIAGIFFSRNARADSYIGAEIGTGAASGTAADLNSGLVLGGTLGYQLIPEFGVALTYQHSALSLASTGTSVSVSQILAEANIFSLLLLHGGLHVGDVTTSALGASSSDFGFGAHLGFDLRLTDRVSAGLGGYWTYVTESNDKHSLFNLVLPLKFWF